MVGAGAGGGEVEEEGDAVGPTNEGEFLDRTVGPNEGGVACTDEVLEENVV